MIWQTIMHAYQNLEYNIIVSITMVTRWQLPNGPNPLFFPNLCF